MNSTLTHPKSHKPTLSEWLQAPNTVFIMFMMIMIMSVAVSIVVPEDFQIAVIILPIVVVAGVASLLRPEFIMLCAIAYIPFEGYELTFMPMSLSKIFGILVIGLLFFNILFRGRSFRILDDSIDFLVILLAVVMLFAIITSEFQSRSVSSTVRMLRMFIYFFAVKNLITSPQTIKTIMWLMSIGGMCASLYGVNDFFANRQVLIHDTRAAGIGMDPNDYAILAIMSLLVTLYLIPITQRNRFKLLLVFNTLSILTGIVLAGSRGGFIALGVTGAIYVWTHPQRMRLIIIIILLVTLSWPVWPASIKARLGVTTAETVDDTASTTATKSLARREAYVSFGITLIEDHPVLGVGYGAFAEHFPRSNFARFDNPTSQTELVRLSHNTYLEMAVGVGILGLFMYVGLLLVLLRNLYMISRKAQYGTLPWSASKAYMLGLLAFMIGSTFLSIPHFDYLWITVAITSALRHFVVQNPQILYNPEV